MRKRDTYISVNIGSSQDVQERGRRQLELSVWHSVSVDACLIAGTFAVVVASSRNWTLNASSAEDAKALLRMALVGGHGR